MAHPKKHQHEYPMRDVATAGRLEGTLLPAATSWYNSLWGVGDGMLSTYTGVDMDAPTGQENESAESSEPASATSTGAGAAAGPV
jgi:hypothetical protein